LYRYATAVSYDIDDVRDYLLSKGADDSIKNEEGFDAGRLYKLNSL
jgi:hypothetical protein